MFFNFFHPKNKYSSLTVDGLDRIKEYSNANLKIFLNDKEYDLKKYLIIFLSKH